jgi:hypothetical protein
MGSHGAQTLPIEGLFSVNLACCGCDGTPLGSRCWLAVGEVAQSLFQGNSAFGRAPPEKPATFDGDSYLCYYCEAMAKEVREVLSLRQLVANAGEASR